MYIHRAVAVFEIVAPNFFHQGVSGEHNAPVLHQVLENFVFFIGQLHFVAVYLHGVSAHVYANGAVVQILFLHPVDAAQQRLYPRDQLHHPKGLGYIVVGAGVQPLNRVDLAGFGSHQDHRQFAVSGGGANGLQHFQSVCARQHNVQQDQIRQVALHLGKEIPAVLKSQRFKSGALQRIAFQLSNTGIVLYNIDLLAHTVTSYSL